MGKTFDEANREMTVERIKRWPGLRADGLAVGKPIFVIQCFDREGYYASCIAHSLQDVQCVAVLLMSKTITAMSIPFPGSWNENMPVITAPDDFKDVLMSLDKEEKLGEGSSA